jgi:hypothetical protein
MEDTTYPSSQAARRTSPIRTLLIAVLVAFLLGAAAAWYWLGRTTDLDLSGLATFRSAESQGPAAAAMPQPQTMVPAPAPASALDQRVAAMEQRLSRLDLQAQAAAGNAGRAEGLLVVFASRRAIERGAPLGYLEDQLQLRFGDAQPNAVRTVIAAGRAPLTLDVLMSRLDTLAPDLVQAPVEDGFFERLRRELGEIFVIRNETTPSPASDQRLARARMFLESGRTGAAAAEIRLLPSAAKAAQWLSAAERHAEVQRALELLETTAILEPRGLRNAEGERIQQVSPVAETAAEPSGAQ